MVQYTFSVTASADDCGESNAGVVDTSSDAITLTTLSWGAGVRFQSVTVPNAAIIQSATLSFKGSASGTAGTTDVYGVDADDTSQWDALNKPSIQTKTTASTAFDNPNTFTPDASYTTYNIDVTAIVQEIVDRGGWSSGNDMSFVIDVDVIGKGKQIVLYTYDHASYPEPTLTIFYTVASGTNMQINISDSWKVVNIPLKIHNGTWRDVVGAQINIGDAWKTIY